jgi:oxygen-independent coproporphyrinogen-3 oxidase
LEITVEANPEDLPEEQLAALRAAGVNRLSLGVQSLEPRHLRALGRLHDPEAARRAVAEARAAGFDNLSLDLMFALSGQTLAELDRDLAGLVELAPDHLSVYTLTVEARTAFSVLVREGLMRLPDSGLATDMYERVRERLGRAGFEHYEISSYARPGRRARHNTLYWTGGEYLGLGCSAHSFRVRDGGGERFATVRSVDKYFAVQQGLGQGPLEGDPGLQLYERLDGAALEREAMWLGLRLLDGIDRAAYARRHGVDPVAAHAPEVERLVGDGLVEVTPERLRLSRRGVLFADEAGARFL